MKPILALLLLAGCGSDPAKPAEPTLQPGAYAVRVHGTFMTPHCGALSDSEITIVVDPGAISLSDATNQTIADGGRSGDAWVFTHESGESHWIYTLELAPGGFTGTEEFSTTAGGSLCEARWDLAGVGPS